MVAPLSDVTLVVCGTLDVEMVRREARRAAGAIGMNLQDVERVTLAASELATNLVRYAHKGRIRIRTDGSPVAIELSSQDEGPGIENLVRALEDGFTTGAGLGSGLPSVRRLMDSFEIETSPQGTLIVARKWSAA